MKRVLFIYRHFQVYIPVLGVKERGEGFRSSVLYGAYAFIFVFVFMASSLRAQDFKKDFEGFFMLFAKSASIECRLASDVFKSAGDTKPMIHKEAVYYIQNDEFYYAIDHIITLCNKNVLLLVDHEHKKMLVTKSDLGHIRKMKKQALDNYKGLELEKTDSLVFEGVRGSDKTYALYKPASMIWKSEYVFNNQNGQLEKIRYIYNQDLSMGAYEATTSITKLSFNPIFPKDIFNENIYVLAVAGGYQPSPAYKEYTLTVLDSDYQKYFKP